MLLKDYHEKRDHHRSCSVLFGMGIACTWPVAAAESHCSAPPAARLVTRHQYIIRNESDVDVPVEQPLQVIEPGQCNPGAREGRHGASSQ